MSNRTINLDDDLYRYLLDVAVREDEVLRRLREETAGLEMARMQISPEQGQFMRLLVKIIGAQRTLEVGVFTGYSTLCVAMALPPHGKITACDVSEEWTGIARRYWVEAGVDTKIDLRLAPALETLAALEASNQRETYDFAFIDADKPNYSAYFEHCLALVRPGGLIGVDNTLWSGRVIDSADQSADTIAIRELNESLIADPRIDLCLLTIGDGLSLAMKR
ncbi:MAG TPA: class I SAM-dependent methyltransferase [Gammaproteobacteria bacterium]